MIKLINRLIALLLLMYATSTVAQDFIAGPLGGLSLSQVDGDAYAGFNKPGINIGGFVLRQFGKYWDVQAEIAYIQKGSRKAPNPEKGDYADFRIDLSYIQFPILAKYHYKKLSFESGITIGSLLSSYEEKDGVEINQEGGVPFKAFEWATLFGFNYHFTNRLWINTRLTYSLNRIRIPYNGEIPIYNPRPHWLSRQPGQYNNNLIFTLYFALNHPIN